jgi:hypothetical protein
MAGLGLLDVCPPTGSVKISGKDFPVYGISAGSGHLLARIPDLEKYRHADDRRDAAAERAALTKAAPMRSPPSLHRR